MKKYLFKIFSILFCGMLALSGAACDDTSEESVSGESSNTNETVVSFADYNERLLVGFDTQSEIMEKTMGQKEMREYKVVTDEKYVTQGTGALKLTHDSEEDYNYMPTAMSISPSVYIFFDKAGVTKDFSKVQAVAVDIYNPQSYPIEVKLYFKTLIREVDWSEFIVDTCYLLPNQMNHCVFDMHLDKYINFGIDNIQTMCLMLPTVESEDELVTLYMDNLRLREFKGEPVYNDQTVPAPLTDGKVMSFEEKSIFNKTNATTIWASWLPQQTLTAFMNRDAQYVSEGKYSLGIIAPCHGDVYRMERGYTNIILPEEYLSVYDFTQFTSPTATLKLDVYFDSPIDNDQFDWIICYQAESSVESIMKRVVLKAGQWNTLEVPMHSGDGTTVDWSQVTSFRFRVFQLKGAGSVKYYFDNIRVEG